MVSHFLRTSEMVKCAKEWLSKMHFFSCRLKREWFPAVVRADMKTFAKRIAVPRQNIIFCPRTKKTKKTKKKTFMYTEQLHPLSVVVDDDQKRVEQGHRDPTHIHTNRFAWMNGEQRYTLIQKKYHRPSDIFFPRGNRFPVNWSNSKVGFLAVTSRNSELICITQRYSSSICSKRHHHIAFSRHCYTYKLVTFRANKKNPHGSILVSSFRSAYDRFYKLRCCCYSRTLCCNVNTRILLLSTDADWNEGGFFHRVYALP